MIGLQRHAVLGVRNKSGCQRRTKDTSTRHTPGCVRNKGDQHQTLPPPPGCRPPSPRNDAQLDAVFPAAVLDSAFSLSLALTCGCLPMEVNPPRDLDIKLNRMVCRRSCVHVSVCCRGCRSLRCTHTLPRTEREIFGQALANLASCNASEQELGCAHTLQKDASVHRLSHDQG